MSGLPRYFLIIDLEATCDDGDIVDREDAEIIEFPWVLYNVELQQVVDVHQTLVLPQTTVITPFCQNLVGISPAKCAKEGLPLASVLDKLVAYVADLQAAPGDLVALTDGKWDLQFLLNKECARKKLPFPVCCQSFYDLQSTFAATFPEAYCHPKPNLRFMVRHVKERVVGTHHCGVDDCLTIAAVVTKLLQAKGTFVKYDVPLVDYDPVADRQFLDFNIQYVVGQVSPQTIISVLSFTQQQVGYMWLADHIPSVGGGPTYIVVLAPGYDYRAQTHFRRGNLRLQVFSYDHFIYRLRLNDPLNLALLYQETIWRSAPELDARSFLKLPLLLKQSALQVQESQSSVSRFQKMAVRDQVALHRLTAAMVLRCCRALIGSEYPRPLEVHEEPVESLEALHEMMTYKQAQVSSVIGKAIAFGQHIHACSRLVLIDSKIFFVSPGDDSGAAGPRSTRMKLLFPLRDSHHRGKTPLGKLPKLRYPVEAEEHYDGIQVTLFWHASQLHIATRETVDASEFCSARAVYRRAASNEPSLPVPSGPKFSVASVVRTVMEERGYPMPPAPPSTQQQGSTVVGYTFSLLLPHESFAHHGIVHYTSADLVFLGCEYSPEDPQQRDDQEERGENKNGEKSAIPDKWRRASRFLVSRFGELRELCWKPGTQLAGVLIDGVCVPSLGYVALRDALNNHGSYTSNNKGASSDRLLQVAKYGDVETICRLWPFFEKSLRSYNSFFVNYGGQLTSNYSDCMSRGAALFEKRATKHCLKQLKQLRSMKQRGISDGEQYLRSLGDTQIDKVYASI